MCRRCDVPPRIRKPLNALTREDLISHAVWEFAGDEEAAEGQDETTVRPYLGALPAERAYNLLSRADFVAASGNRYIGYVSASPGTEADISTFQPVIVCDAGQVGFWYGAVVPSERELRENFSKLETVYEHLFPITYRSSDGALSRPVEGMITAFVYFETQ